MAAGQRYPIHTARCAIHEVTARRKHGMSERDRQASVSRYSWSPVCWVANMLGNSDWLRDLCIVVIACALGVATWSVLLDSVTVDDFITFREFATYSAAALSLGAMAGFAIRSQRDRWFLWVGLAFVLLSFALVPTLGFLTWWASLLLFAFGLGSRLRRRIAGKSVIRAD